MNSINLYFANQISDNLNFNNYIKAESNNLYFENIKLSEQETIKSLINDILSYGKVSIENFDGFYIDFKIPHIGKEFDLLKFSKEQSAVLNIELKSEDVGDDIIEHQLKLNDYYLSSVSQNKYLYTYVNGGKIYKFVNGNLYTTTINDLIDKLNDENFLKFISKDIETCFKPSDYLISPVNDIERFVSKKYFLTNEQSEKKKEILSLINNNETLAVVLRGKAGTGKTLLTYDIAYELSNKFKILIVFCGNLSGGHEKLNAKLSNIDIISIKNADNISYEYGLVIIDETQRIIDKSWNFVINNINKKGIPIIFVGDEEQFLSAKEKKSGHFSRTIDLLNNSNKKITFKLKNKIRTNKLLASFIDKLLDYSKNIDPHISFEKINITFASTNLEAIKLIKYYKNLDYIFINFTSAIQGDNYYDDFKEYADFNSHEAVGQEFDNVVVVINNNFGYYKDGNRELLREKFFHPTRNYIYRKMLSQALTRARDKISIIIANDINLGNL